MGYPYSFPFDPVRVYVTIGRRCYRGLIPALFMLQYPIHHLSDGLTKR